MNLLPIKKSLGLLAFCLTIIMACKKEEHKVKLTDRLVGKKYRSYTVTSLPELGINERSYLVLSFKTENKLDYYRTTVDNNLIENFFPEATWEPVEEYGDKVKIQFDPTSSNILILEAEGDSLATQYAAKVIYKEFKD